jgi:hypothetical protein
MKPTAEKRSTRQGQGAGEASGSEVTGEAWRETARSPLAGRCVGQNP